MLHWYWPFHVLHVRLIERSFGNAKRELYDESVKSMRNEIRCLFSQLRAEKTDNRQFPDVVARIEAAADKIEKAADRIDRAASAIQRSSNKIANSSSIISMLKTLEKL